MKNCFGCKGLRTAALVILTAVLAFSSLAFGSTPVFAQGTTPPDPQATQPALKADKRKAALEAALARENAWLLTQANHLQKMSDLAVKAQALIDKAKDKGLNVAGLQAALNVFKAQTHDAQGIHNTAAAILQAHKGFDDSGKVTNLEVAAQTVRDARQSLSDAHLVIKQAVTDIRVAMRAFREEHKGSRQSAPATPTPAPGL